MECSKCGAINNDGASFCVKCLSPLKKNDNISIQSNASLTNGVQVQPNASLTNGVQAQSNASLTNEVMNQSGDSSNFQNKNVKNEIDNSIIRRSIKKDAKSRKKGPVIVSYVIMLVSIIVIYSAFAYFSIQNFMNQYNTFSQVDSDVSLFYLGYILVAIIEFLLLFIITKTSLEVSRGNKVTVGQSFAYVLNHLGTWLKTLGLYILFFIVLFICLYVLLFKLAISPILVVLIFVILLLYFTPVLAVYLFLAVDDINSIDLKEGRLNKCMELVHGHRTEYFALLLSFIGWILLMVIASNLIGTWLISYYIRTFISLSIYTIPLMYLVMLLPMLLFSIWLVPYMQVSFANWYRYINKEAEYKNASDGITNQLLIALVILVYVIIFALQFIG